MDRGSKSHGLPTSTILTRFGTIGECDKMIQEYLDMSRMIVYHSEGKGGVPSKGKRPEVSDAPGRLVVRVHPVTSDTATLATVCQMTPSRVKLAACGPVAAWVARLARS